MELTGLYVTLDGSFIKEGSHHVHTVLVTDKDDLVRQELGFEVEMECRAISIDDQLRCGESLHDIYNLVIYNLVIYDLRLSTGEGEREGGTVRLAAYGLDSAELLLVLSDIVLEGTKDFLCLVGGYYDTRYHVCLGNTGHQLREVKNELRRSMCDKCQVGEHALLLVRGNVDFLFFLFRHNMFNC